MPANADRGGMPSFNWRMAFFLGLLVVAVAFGLIWKRDGSPPESNLQQQQEIQLFVSDPQATVHLTAAFPNLSAGKSLENLYLSITSPNQNEDVHWALISILRPINCNGPSMAASSRILLGAAPASQLSRAWICLGDTTGSSPGSLASPGRGQLPGVVRLAAIDPQATTLIRGSLTSSMTFPRVSESFPGDIFARLPALDDEPLPQPGVGLIVEHSPEPKNFSYLLNEAPRALSPALADSSNILSYVRSTNLLAGLQIPYFVPSNITTQSIMELDTLDVATYHMDQVDPSNGSFQYNNFVWSGTGFTEPTLALSDPKSDAGRADDYFLSGVALAVAASAFIALVQEFRVKEQRQTLSDSPSVDAATKKDPPPTLP
jgi:hypothetical protein